MQGESEQEMQEVMLLENELLKLNINSQSGRSTSKSSQIRKKNKKCRAQ
jgi:hypothetical protein